MSNLQWFRLYHRIIDDEKIRLLAFEDRWHFIAVCCLKADGLLDEPESSLKWRKVAVKLGVQLRELDEIQRRLFEVGLVDDDMQPQVDFTASAYDRPAPAMWRALRSLVFDRDDYTCTYCGVRGVRMACDHVIPVSRGGGNGIENLTTACEPCNQSKGAKTPAEWLQ